MAFNKHRLLGSKMDLAAIFALSNHRAIQWWRCVSPQFREQVCVCVVQEGQRCSCINFLVDVLKADELNDFLRQRGK